METRWVSFGHASEAALSATTTRAPCQWPCKRGGPIHGGCVSFGRRLHESAMATHGRRVPDLHGVERLLMGWQASSGHSQSTMALSGYMREGGRRGHGQTSTVSSGHARGGRQACSGHCRSSKVSSGRGHRVGHTWEGKLLAMGRKAHESTGTLDGNYGRLPQCGGAWFRPHR